MEGAADILRDLAERVGEECASGDPARITQLRFRLDRLARRIHDGNRPECVAVTTTLSALTSLLTANLTAVELRHESERSYSELPVLRDRLYEAIRQDGPTRPGELAVRFDVDPSQIIRALNDLVAQGRVKVEHPAVGDRRARLYSVVGTTPVANPLKRPRWNTSQAIDQLTKRIGNHEVRAVVVLGEKDTSLWTPGSRSDTTLHEVLERLRHVEATV